MMFIYIKQHAVFLKRTRETMYARRPPGFRVHNAVVLLIIFIIFGSVVAFAINRANIFMQELHKLQEQRISNEWLLMQCDDGDFHKNMAHHSKLCEEVKVAHDDVLFLIAIDKVIQRTYLCGYRPCLEILDDTMTWLVKRSLVVLTFTSALVFCLPLLVWPLWRMYSTHVADVRMHCLYQDPHLLQNQIYTGLANHLKSC